MKPSQILSLSLLLLLGAPGAWSASVFQCEDDKGNRTFEQHCPPGTKPVDKKDYTGDDGTAPETTRATVTIYLVPNCDTCDQVKEFLSVRNIRPIEKNVAGDVRLQEELKKRAGDLRVPVTVIGDSVVGGYNRAAMLDALAANGYGPGEESGAAEGGESGEGEEAVDEEETPEEEAPAAEEPATTE